MVEKLNIFRRRNSETLIDDEAIQTTYTSSSIHTEDYRNFVLYLDIVSTGTPTDILFHVEFSDDNTNWYRLTDWWYGYLDYTDAQTEDGIKESMGYYIQGRYVRLRTVVTGGATADYFTVTAKMEFFN